MSAADSKTLKIEPTLWGEVCNFKAAGLLTNYENMYVATNGDPIPVSHVLPGTAEQREKNAGCVTGRASTRLRPQSYIEVHSQVGTFSREPGRAGIGPGYEHLINIIWGGLLF